MMADKATTLVGSVPVNKHPRIGSPNPDEFITVTVRLKRKTEDGLPTIDEFAKGKRAINITRADLTNKYAASPEGAESVEKWAMQQDLKIAEVDLGGRRIRVTGSIAQIENAFGVKLSVYRHAKTGAAFRCPESDPQIPTALTPYIAWVNGLDTMPAVVRHLVRVSRKGSQIDPKGQWPGSFYPNEVAQLYNFPTTTGEGQSVAILEFGGGIDRTVLDDYFKQAIGLAQSPTINTISILDTPIQVDDDVTGEVYLDIEVVGAMAPGATMDVYFAPWTGDGYLTAIETATRKADYAALSISYGIDEDLVGDAQNPGWPALHQQVDEAFREAVAIGLPVFVSSGDQGSSSLRGQVGQQEVTVYGKTAAVGYPGSSLYATSVGGTMLYAEGNKISREVVWNELGPLQKETYYFGGATGGGVSVKYPLPSYQSDAGIAAKCINKKSVTGRVVPDVAGNSGSTTGYLVSQTPNSQVGPIAPVGGTSAAAPMWAALMACVGEALAKGGEAPAAPFFFNDFVYACGKTDAFQDIVGGREFNLSPQGYLQPGPFIPVGNNQSAKIKGYSAAKGFDPCTGWGSPNGQKLLEQLKTWLAAQPKQAPATITKNEI